MAPKMTPAKLRAQAKELLEQAKKAEEKRQILIGRLVSEFIDKDFDGFDLTLFKAQATQLWEDGKIKKISKKDSLKVAS